MSSYQKQRKSRTGSFGLIADSEKLWTQTVTALFLQKYHLDCCKNSTYCFSSAKASAMPLPTSLPGQATLDSCCAMRIRGETGRRGLIRPSMGWATGWNANEVASECLLTSGGGEKSSQGSSARASPEVTGEVRGWLMVPTSQLYGFWDVSVKHIFWMLNFD